MPSAVRAQLRSTRSDSQTQRRRWTALPRPAGGPPSDGLTQWDRWFLEQAPDLEHLGPAQALPGHGLGAEDLGRAPGDRLQGGQRRPPGGGGQPIQIRGDRVLEIGEAGLPRLWASEGEDLIWDGRFF